ncbi:MAG TPA: 16S rRNA (cytidine(1402)-2'-O)-methyltransferase [Accumulibacter sp.]|nr:16S rRNA (cytidine(1402)-2'-O)-methyltransferase [Accumulibacter sp.]HMW16263.1 16S rRNA (cytidine(1402)-2'-O)-methyltransferase [Accumulibacter sp.]HMX23126.1 16S rRNA (cytidine(1402)-2'-O)-methyltransferase [Accumulibacter sp.]HNC16774.1 16S rRNA (cytidine(1402)-2'-O)-methyltransferase [Accumulibacter sp.]HND79058.1 16S rRNA (cytidine(1402)-2'-O)-methyltransferase [Accumulibacter sp.]
MTNESPALYVVPTPIGHLGDITRRAIDLLRDVPWVAAEDTRHSGPMLREIGCRARLLAANQHNVDGAARQIIGKLRDGEAVALVVDAGTPGISDPGARLVAQVRAAGFRVVPLPGACAAIAALSAAGIGDAHFLFYGFLPAKAGPRDAVLRELATLPYALIFYEAPHRIVDTVAALLKVCDAARTVVLARELTKLFETIHSCPLGEMPGWLAADVNRQRGEFVLIVAGASADADEQEGRRVLKLLLDDGLPPSQACRLAQAITGVGKNALYRQALDWQSAS